VDKAWSSTPGVVPPSGAIPHGSAEKVAPAPLGGEGHTVSGYDWYVCGLLAATYAVHTMDRGVFTVLLQPIKHEFGLSDTQLGFLAGMAFALAYAIAAVPMGMLADRVNRRNLLAFLIAAWSLLTTLGSLAHTFIALVLIRIGVGLAEAGGQPLALSLIGDYLPKPRRAAAAGIFMSGTGVGSLIGLATTGAVAAAWGWRAAFLVVGLPGVLVALLVMLTLREPPRGRFGANTRSHPAKAGLGETIRFIGSQRALVLMLAGTALVVLGNSGVAIWAPTFLVRTHGLSLAQAGLAMGLVSGITAFGGSLAGAWAVDRLGRGNIARQPRFAAAVSVVSAVGVVLATNLASTPASIAAFMLWAFSFAAAHGACFGLTATLVPARMRGVTVGIMALLNNLVGYGLGPQVGGIASDLLRPAFGNGSLPLAMTGIGLVSYLLGAVFLFLASRRVRADLARVED